MENDDELHLLIKWPGDTKWALADIPLREGRHDIVSFELEQLFKEFVQCLRFCSFGARDFCGGRPSPTGSYLGKH